MRVRALSLAGLLACLAWLVAPTRADVAELSAYEGAWQYADGGDGRQEIERAIARSVDRLPFYAEAIAAGRVRQMTGPFDRVSFRMHREQLLFQADDWGPVGARVGGPAQRIPGPDGTPLMLRQYIEGGRLTQVFVHPEGTRHNTFALSGDRRWLWMSVRISSPRLPDDCRYRLRYRRVDDAPTRVAGR